MLTTTRMLTLMRLRSVDAKANGPLTDNLQQPTATMLAVQTQSAPPQWCEAPSVA